MTKTPATPTPATTPQPSSQPSSRNGRAKQAEQQHLLRRLAVRYIWWKTAEEALRYPQRILAQVMNLGDYADVQEMVETFGTEALRAVLRQAEAGQLNERSWAYWHYRLGLAEPGQVPPMPTRRIS